MTGLRHGHATHPDWRMATELALAQIEGQRGQAPAGLADGNLGLVYLTDGLAPHAAQILALLQRRTGIAHWAGTCGQGLVACGVEYLDEPAISVMLCALPADGFTVFSGTRPPPSVATRTASGAVAANAALVHGDPQTPDLVELVEDMAGKVASGRLFGGIASGRATALPQVADRVVFGGLSGVVFASNVDLRMRVTQGCWPLAAEHVISECDANLIRGLDGRPALDVLLADLGVDASVRDSRDGETLLRALPASRIRSGLFVGLAAGERPSGGRTAGPRDWVVRNLVGIDPRNRLVAVAARPTEGDRMVFCTRDAAAARADLIRVCTELRDEVETEGLAIRGGVYVSCLARGQALFGAPSAEVGLVHAQLGTFPLVGFFANGEIADGQLYGHTGVLTLFVGPRHGD